MSLGSRVLSHALLRGSHVNEPLFSASCDDNFGHSVAAIESFVAVSGPFESGGQRGVSGQDSVNAADNSAHSSGAVYVYR